MKRKGYRGWHLSNQDELNDSLFQKELKILQLAAVNVRIESKSSNPGNGKNNFKKKEKGQ